MGEIISINQVPPQERDPSKESGERVQLITMEEFKEYPEGTEFINFSGKKQVKGKDEIDLDTRNGYLTYGFLEHNKPADGISILEIENQEDVGKESGEGAKRTIMTQEEEKKSIAELIRESKRTQELRALPIEERIEEMQSKFFAEVYSGSNRPTGKVYKAKEPRRFSNDVLIPNLDYHNTIEEAEEGLDDMTHEDEEGFLRFNPS